MVEKKKGKKRKEDYVPPGEEELAKPTKEEYRMADWMHRNVTTKRTKFLNYHVTYFTGRRAVDALMASPWSDECKEPRDRKTTILFHDRGDVVDYLNDMLDHKFFHRARKVVVSESELRHSATVADKRHADKATASESETTSKTSKETKSDCQPEEQAPLTPSEVQSTTEDTSLAKKKKMKVRLEMHEDQRFADNWDAYVWIYDPIPFHYWICGALTLLAAIGICLFPLWPPSVRLVVYYLSMAAAGFLVFLVLLVVLRFIIYSTIWALTLGRHHLWIMPNLTEDVGFFASFWPFYQYEYKPPSPSKTTAKKEKKKRKEKISQPNQEQFDRATIDAEMEKLFGVNTLLMQANALMNLERTQESAVEEVEKNGGAGSASESESSSQRSSTGRDFEMVNQDDLEPEHCQ